VRGLYQKPTVINNVETLSNIAWIVANGGEAFKKIGHEKDPGHAAHLDLRAHRAAGVYEIECGYPFAKFILRGLRRRHRRPADQGHHPRRHFDQGADRQGNRDAHARQSLARGAGSSMGSGGMVVDRRRHVHGAPAASAAALLSPRVVRPVHAVPRRHGMAAPDHRPHRRRRGRPEDVEASLPDLAWNDGTTICGMGDAAGYATSGILNKFRDEFEYFIEHKRSRYDGALECPRFS
jgi:NADH-quinone oxidoreductase subunit F